MATCKECLYAEVCKAIVTIINEATELQIDDDIETTIDADLTCKYFADRSRFVELPCKLGDTVYYFNSAGEIFSQKVSGFIVNFVGILVDSDVMFDSHLMGDRFFSTREEAERALKERET